MGVKPVYRITTKSGKQLKTTLNHPYLTKNGWRKLKDIKVGEEIAVIKPYLHLRGASSKTGEGINVLKETNDYMLTTNDYRVVRDKCLGSINFPAMTNFGNEDIIDFPIEDYPVISNLEAIGINWTTDYVFSENQRIGLSKIVFDFKDYSILDILRQFQEHSFGLAGKIVGNHLSPSLFFTSLLETLPDLRDSSREERNLGSEASISSSISSMVSLSKTNPRVLPLLSTKRTIPVNEKGNFAACDGFSRTTFSSDNPFNNDGTISPPPYLEDTTPIYLSQDNLGIAYEPIISIEPLGNLHVYDIEVESTHNFVAQGIVAHNTVIKKAQGDMGTEEQSGEGTKARNKKGEVGTKDFGIASDNKVEHNRAGHKLFHLEGKFSEVINDIAEKIGAKRRGDGKWDLRGVVEKAGGRLETSHGELRIEEDGALVIVDNRFSKDHAGRGEYAVYARNEIKVQHELKEVRLWADFARSKGVVASGMNILDVQLGQRLRGWMNGRGEFTCGEAEKRERQEEVEAKVEEFHQQGLAAERQHAPEIAMDIFWKGIGIWRKLELKVLFWLVKMNVRNLFDNYDTDLEAFVMSDEEMEKFFKIMRAGEKNTGKVVAFDINGLIVIPEACLYAIKDGDKKAVYALQHERRHNDYRSIHGEQRFFTEEQRIISEIYAHFAGYIDVYGVEELQEGEWVREVSQRIIRSYLRHITDIKDKQRTMLKVEAAAHVIGYFLREGNHSGLFLEYLKNIVSLDELLAIRPSKKTTQLLLILYSDLYSQKEDDWQITRDEIKQGSPPFQQFIDFKAYYLQRQEQIAQDMEQGRDVGQHLDSLQRKELAQQVRRGEVSIADIARRIQEMGVSVEHREDFDFIIASDRKKERQNMGRVMENVIQKKDFRDRVGKVIAYSIEKEIESGFDVNPNGEFGEVVLGKMGSIKQFFPSKGGVGVHYHPLFEGSVEGGFPRPSYGDCGRSNMVIVIWGIEDLGFFATQVDMEKLGGYEARKESLKRRPEEVVKMLRKEKAVKYYQIDLKNKNIFKEIAYEVVDVAIKDMQEYYWSKREKRTSNAFKKFKEKPLGVIVKKREQLESIVKHALENLDLVYDRTRAIEGINIYRDDLKGVKLAEKSVSSAITKKTQDAERTTQDDKDGRCLTPDSAIHLADGTKKPLIELKEGDYVLSLNQDSGLRIKDSVGSIQHSGFSVQDSGRLEPHKVNALLDMGVKPVYRITTKSGKTLKTTLNHPYLTKQGWRKLKNIGVGEEIAVVKPIYHRVGDNGKKILFRPGSDFVFFNNKEFPFKAEFIKFLKKVKSIFNNFRFGHILDVDDYYAMGVSYIKPQDIPEVFIEGKQNVIVGQGVIKENIIRGPPQISIKDTNQIKPIVSKGANDISVNTLVGKNGHNGRLDLRNYLGGLFHKLRSVFNSSNSIFLGNIRILLGDFFQLVSTGNKIKDVAYGDTSSFNAGFAKSNFWVNSYSSFAHNNPTSTTKDTTLSNSSQEYSGITYEPIISIEPLGSLHVYDIEVEGTHNFVAEGIVAHNTVIKDEGLRMKEYMQREINQGFSQFALVSLWKKITTGFYHAEALPGIFIAKSQVILNSQGLAETKQALLGLIEEATTKITKDFYRAQALSGIAVAIANSELPVETKQTLLGLIEEATTKIADDSYLAKALSWIAAGIAKGVRRTAHISLEEGKKESVFNAQWEELTAKEQIYLSITFSQEEIESLPISTKKKEFFKRLKDSLVLQQWAGAIMNVKELTDIEDYYNELIKAKELLKEVSQKQRLKEQIDVEEFFNAHSFALGMVQTIERGLLRKVFEYYLKQQGGDNHNPIVLLRDFFAPRFWLSFNRAEELKTKLEGKADIEDKMGVILQAMIKDYTDMRAIHREEPGSEVSEPDAHKLHQSGNAPWALEKEIQEQDERGNFSDREFDSKLQDKTFQNQLIAAVAEHYLDDKKMLEFDFATDSERKAAAERLVKKFIEAGSISEISNISWQEATVLAKVLLLDCCWNNKTTIKEIGDKEIFGAEVNKSEPIELYHVGRGAKYKESINEIVDIIRGNGIEDEELLNNIREVWERFEYEGGVWAFRIKGKGGNPKTYMFAGRDESTKTMLERFTYRAGEVSLMQYFDLYRDDTRFYYYEKGSQKFIPEGRERSDSFVISRGLIRYYQSLVLDVIGLKKANLERFKKEFKGETGAGKTYFKFFVSRVMGYGIIRYLAQKKMLGEKMSSLGEIIKGRIALSGLLDLEQKDESLAITRMAQTASSAITKKRYGAERTTQDGLDGLCLTPDSAIHLADGTKKPLIELKEGDYVLSLNQDSGSRIKDSMGSIQDSTAQDSGRLEPHRVNALLDMGVKPVYRITTKSGKQLKTTLNHPYLTKSGWRKLKDIRVSEEIAVVERDTLHEIRNTKKGEEIAVMERKLALISTSSDFNSFYEDSFPFNKERNTMFSYSEAMGTWGQVDEELSANERVSKAGIVFEFFPNSLLNFLRKMFNVSFTSRGELERMHNFYFNPNSFSISSRGIQPSFSASFNDFLREDINLGLRGNLDSILSISQPAGFTDLLWYSSVESLSNKAESISERMSRKAEVLKANIRDFPSLSTRTAEREFLSDFIPKQANFPKVTVLPDALRIGDNFDKVGSAIDKPPFIKKNTMPIYSSQEDLGIIYEPIISIEPLGNLHVYDIEVEGTHNFVAEGIVAHNTYADVEKAQSDIGTEEQSGEGEERSEKEEEEVVYPERSRRASSAVGSRKEKDAITDKKGGILNRIRKNLFYRFFTKVDSFIRIWTGVCLLKLSEKITLFTKRLSERINGNDKARDEFFYRLYSKFILLIKRKWMGVYLRENIANDTIVFERGLKSLEKDEITTHLSPAFYGLKSLVKEFKKGDVFKKLKDKGYKKVYFPIHTEKLKKIMQKLGFKEVRSQKKYLNYLKNSRKGYKQLHENFSLIFPDKMLSQSTLFYTDIKDFPLPQNSGKTQSISSPTVFNQSLSSSTQAVGKVDVGPQDNTPGGIDLNPKNLEIDVRGKSIDLPKFNIPFDIQNFQGFTFNIIKIEVIEDLNSVLNIPKEKHKEKEKHLSRHKDHSQAFCSLK